jgi:hypothetical protein
MSYQAATSMMTWSDLFGIVNIEISSSHNDRKVKFQAVRRGSKIKFLLHLFSEAEFEKEKTNKQQDWCCCHCQSEYWNSSSRVAGVTVQNLPALIEWTHRSEPTSSPQSQNNYTVNQTVRNHSLNNIALIFWPAASVISSVHVYQDNETQNLMFSAVRPVSHTNARQTKFSQ